MDKLKKLRAEIEKLLNGPAPNHDQQCDWSDGYWCALYKIEGLLEELEKETEEPKEYQNALNSEAMTFLSRQGIIPNLYADQIMRAVKHGASWQKRRDERGTLEGQITSGGAGNYNVAAFRFDEDHTFTVLLPADPESRYGDKVRMKIWKNIE